MNLKIVQSNLNYYTIFSVLELTDIFNFIFQVLKIEMKLFCGPLFQVEDLKAKLATQEVELQLRNTDTEALIAKIGQQSEKLSQERSVADAEEQRVRHTHADIHPNIQNHTHAYELECHMTLIVFFKYNCYLCECIC